MMKKQIFSLCVCLAFSTGVQALTIDARVGNLSDPKNSALISQASAEEKLHIKDAEATFEKLYWKLPKKNQLPKGVRQSGKSLIITAPYMAPLHFKGAYWPPGKDGSESDSEDYVYVHEFEKYHLVAIQYGHDTPDYVLVDKKTLKLFIVKRAAA